MSQVDHEDDARQTMMKQPSTLVGMGFEYRLVRCPLHISEEASQKESTSYCLDCVTRLFHVPSETMITPSNRNDYITDGPMFDHVSCMCQEMTQARLQKEYALKFITICNDTTLGEPVRALVDQDFDEYDDKANHQKPTLLIMAGKGKSRAGILSVNQLVISGIEIGSALFHLHQARKRGWAVILLDPNARGMEKGMDTVERSLTHLFGSWTDAPLHVLAHSAAGGYLVRYLLLGPARTSLLENIRALVFTDSTHNLPWARGDPALFRFLQSKQCLYIRNTKVHVSDTFGNHNDRKLGEEVEGDIWWRRRFGDIRTVWAGTIEHSLMCWMARNILWDFMDDYDSSPE